MDESKNSENYDFYINSDLEKYAGKWIAVIDGTIAAAGERADELIQIVRKKYPQKKFLLSRVLCDHLQI